MRIVLLIILSIILLNTPQGTRAQDFSASTLIDPAQIHSKVDKTVVFDANNDGLPDILVGGGTNNHDISLFLNQPGNLLDSARIISTGFNVVRGIQATDIDNDGDEDVLLYADNAFKVQLNDGQGNFDEPLSLHSGGIGGFRIEDYNVDGLPDILYYESGRYNGGNIYFLENTGALSFNTAVQLEITGPTSYLVGLQSADFDDDSDIDFLGYYDGYPGSEVFFLENDGTGKYEGTNLFDTFLKKAITLSDLNSDGYTDISYTVSGEIHIWANDMSNGFTFLKSLDVSGHGDAYPVDTDADGDMDLLYGHSVYGNTIYENDGDANFTQTENIANVTLPGSVTSDDFDNDGDIDLLTATSGDGDIIIHLKQEDGTYLSNNYVGYNMTSITRLQYLDFNRDGLKDIILIDGRYRNKITVKYNTGNGSYSDPAAVIFDTSAGMNITNDAYIEDFNADGKWDLLYLYHNDLKLASNIEEINNTETIILKADFHFRENVRDMGIGDIDNDGDIDIFIETRIGVTGDINPFWMENTGSDTYVHHSIPEKIDVKNHSLKDISGDGYLDLILSQNLGSSDQRFRVYFFDPTTGEFLFTQEISPISQGDMVEFTIADSDNDGDGDIIYGNRNNIFWSENVNGTFSAEQILIPDQDIYDIIVDGDLNNDGIVDFAFNTREGGSVAINNGDNTFEVNQYENISASGGVGVEDILLNDLDNDGITDILSTFYSEAVTLPIWYKTCYNSSSTIDEVVCENFVAPSGAVFTSSGTYEDIIPNAIGCDSIITINLTVNPVYDEAIEASICEGETYTLGSQDISMAGEYTELFQSKAGCDSTVVLNLTVNTLFEETAEETICQGETYVFGDQNITMSGEYTEVFLSQYGCDSTVVLDLTVNPSFNEEEEASICAGETYIFGSQILTTTGEYVEIFQSHLGCDSTVTLSLSVNPISNETAEVTICEGETYIFGTETLSAPGEYTEIFQSGAGCDSTVVLNLTIAYPYNESVEATICEGNVYNFGSQSLTSAGQYTEIFQSEAGCDSTVVLNLSVNPIYHETASAAICEGESFEFGDQTLTTAGEYSVVFKSTAGCDSTVVLNLDVKPVYSETAEITICEGKSYTFGTQTLTMAGEYTEIFTSITGCDSLVVLDLAVNPEFNETASATICEGETYDFGSSSLTAAGHYTETFQSIAGCDSTVMLNLSVNSTYNGSESVEICQGETLVFGGQNLTAAGDYTEVFQSQITGCDSIVVLSLSIKSINTTVTVEGSSLIADMPNAQYQWINCDTETVVENESGQTFTPEASGFYAVEISEGGCTEVSSCIETNLVTDVFADEVFNSLIAYPVPVENELQVKFGEVIERGSFELYDLKGNIVLSGSINNEESLKLDIDVENGMYMLQLKREGGHPAFIKILVK